MSTPSYMWEELFHLKLSCYLVLWPLCLFTHWLCSLYSNPHSLIFITLNTWSFSLNHWSKSHIYIPWSHSHPLNEWWWHGIIFVLISSKLNKKYCSRIKHKIKNIRQLKDGWPRTYIKSESFIVMSTAHVMEVPSRQQHIKQTLKLDSAQFKWLYRTSGVQTQKQII